MRKPRESGDDDCSNSSIFLYSYSSSSGHSGRDWTILLHHFLGKSQSYGQSCMKNFTLVEEIARKTDVRLVNVTIFDVVAICKIFISITKN